jgi:hypothetical protein
MMIMAVSGAIPANIVGTKHALSKRRTNAALPS